MKNLMLSITASLLVIFVSGCEQSEEPAPAAPAIEDQLFKSDKSPGRTMVWADGELFESVVTPTEFDGVKGNYDKLYVGDFYDGVGLISESKPGDQDYNGGRWNVCVLKAGVTTDYSMATSDQDLDPNDFESANAYFVCPLLPRRGNK